jgi:hypothetical protein
MRKLLLLLSFAFALHTPASAQSIIAFTSFEEPAAVGGQYVDTGDPNVDHALASNPGEPVVNFTSTGGELGFTSSYTNSRGTGVGLTDGDLVGVRNETTDVGSYIDGTQGFEINDPDGVMTVTLDDVDLTGAANPFVTVSYFLTSTGWETDDRARIWVVADGVELDLLNTAGSDIDDLGIEGAWQTVSLDLTGNALATLHFELDSNSGAENMYVDQIVFSDGALPVELTTFTARLDGRDALLSWQTASETNNAGFDVQSLDAGAWQTLGFVPGAGTTSETQNYAFRVDALAPGTHRFRLRQIDFDGAFAFSPVVELTVDLPEPYRLTAAFPNPFNPRTSFELIVRRSQRVTVSVFDVLGRRVATLFDGTMAANEARSFSFDGAGLPSGLYLYRAEGESFSATRQALLLK